MKASELFDIIKSDMEKLSVYKSTIEQKILADNKDSNSVSSLMTKYNYNNFTEILNVNNIILNFTIDADKLKDFQYRLNNYLELYASDDADLKRYITGISTYLTFIAKRPLHPPGLEFSNGAKVFEKDGLFYCSGKRTFIKDDLSLCKYCVCRPV